ncbi:MAG: metallophosphoesterase [Prolixibacteraceae bacterium]
MMDMNKKDERIIWAATRSALENGHKKNMRNGASGVRYWDLFEKGLTLLVWLLKLVRLYDRGHHQALDVKIEKHQLTYSELPESFNNFRILHLSDLHLDADPETTASIIKAINQLEYDLCVMTGDFRLKTHGRYKQLVPLLQKLVQNIQAKSGIYATLGNHDTYRMVADFEALGINVLCNETINLTKGAHQIALTGTDDVHYYFTENAIDCLENTPDGFKIALVHSPELYDVASENKYNLYLCGHTHGGQICLPGGKALLIHLYNGKHLSKGLWKNKDMIGYTSEGCGTSGIPIRFNSQSEITLFTLQKG